MHVHKQCQHVQMLMMPQSLKSSSTQPNASIWDYGINGSEYGVILYSMYATANSSLAFYLWCLFAAREDAEIFYPGWRVRVYHDNSISPDDLAVARSRGVETIHISDSDISGNIAGMCLKCKISAHRPRISHVLTKGILRQLSTV